MHHRLNRLLSWLGTLPPLRFVLLGAGAWAASVLATLNLGPLVLVGSPGELVQLVGFAILAILATVVIWHREDDPLEAGLLLAGVFLLASVPVSLLVALFTPGDSVLAALVRQPFQLLLPAVVMVPFWAAVVWLARRLTAGVTRSAVWWRSRHARQSSAAGDPARHLDHAP